MGKSTKDQRDHYYRQGKQEGYRARSAYKLLHLDEQYGILGGAHSLSDTTALGAMLRHEIDTLRAEKPVCVLDLCAAPGSWSQVLSRALGGARIVAVDLQQMAPIPGVIQIVGDITTDETARAIQEALSPMGVRGAQDAPGIVDLVVCDGAPDVTGIAPLDEYVQSQLLLAAASMAGRALRRGGNFVAKVFVQPGSESARLLVAQLRRQYEHVELAKPRSSRASSAEHFVVCASFVQAHDGFLGDLAGYSLRARE